MPAAGAGSNRGLRFPGPRSLAAAVAVVLLVLVVTPAGRKQLRLSFTKSPAHYTELFFGGANCPADADAGAGNGRAELRDP